MTRRSVFILTAAAIGAVGAAAYAVVGSHRARVAARPCPLTRTPPGSEGSMSGRAAPGARTEGWYEVVRNPVTGTTRGFVLLARGSAGWNRGLAESHDSASEPVDVAGRWRSHTERRIAGVRYATDYDERSDSVRVSVAGRSVGALGLAAGNVLLLDRVDGRGGPPSLRQAGCVPAEPPESIVGRAAALHAVRNFAR